MRRSFSLMSSELDANTWTISGDLAMPGLGLAAMATVRFPLSCGLSFTERTRHGEELNCWQVETILVVMNLVVVVIVAVIVMVAGVVVVIAIVSWSWVVVLLLLLVFLVTIVLVVGVIA